MPLEVLCPREMTGCGPVYTGVNGGLMMSVLVLGFTSSSISRSNFDGFLSPNSILPNNFLIFCSSVAEHLFISASLRLSYVGVCGGLNRSATSRMVSLSSEVMR